MSNELKDLENEIVHGLKFLSNKELRAASFKVGRPWTDRPAIKKLAEFFAGYDRDPDSINSPDKLPEGGAFILTLSAGDLQPSRESGLASIRRFARNEIARRGLNWQLRFWRRGSNMSTDLVIWRLTPIEADDMADRSDKPVGPQLPRQPDKYEIEYDKRMKPKIDPQAE